MAIIDWVIVIFVVISVLAAAKAGLIVEVCSLAGLIFGFVLASWNYQSAGLWLRQWIHTQTTADALGFLLIVLGTLIAAAIVGRILRWSAKSIGLGWADRLAGAAFGFVKGCAVVTVAVVVMAAFWPQATWFRESYLAPEFLAMANRASAVTPSDLRERIRQGVTTLKKDQPNWMRPSA
jgi:membrane protein required for colicin V production